MTISTTSTKKVYSGNAVATVFAYDFFIQAATDIEVYIADPDGLLELQTLTTDYTLSGVGNPAGGNVTFVSGAPATGTNNVLLIRDTPLTQETDYIEGDTFPAEEHEKALDKLTRICQELREQVDRAVKTAANSAIDPDEIVVALLAASVAAAASAAQAAASEVAAELAQTGAEAAQVAAEAAAASVPSFPVADTVNIIKGSADATKIMRFEVDGFTAGQTRVMTPPDADANLAGTNLVQTWTIQRTNEVTDNDGSFDLNAGQDFKCTPTAGFTLTFTNIPATPLVQHGTIILVNPSAYAVAAHANVRIGASLLATLSAAGTYQLSYRTSNGIAYVTGSGALS